MDGSGDRVSGSRSGSSLPVPNVQELASRGLAAAAAEIPERYIRSEAEGDPVAIEETVELPILDLSRLFDPRFHHKESLKLKSACEEWGFFQLINHGVDEELMKKMRDDLVEFFKLPLEEKKAYAQLPNNLEGYGQAFVTSEEQKLDWADMLYIVTQPLDSRNLRFWPSRPPTFRDTLDKYSWALMEVARTLLGFMAQNMGLDPEILLSKFKGRSQAMRINYYPPCPKSSKVLGLSPHTDAVGLTLLFQASEVHGLQIKKFGKWLPIQVLPSALIVNIGDFLEIMSNGQFKSIEHRAIINSEKERISIAAFHSPSNGVMVGPLPELVDGGEEKYMSMSYENYMKSYFSEKLDGRSFLERMQLN